MKLCKRDAEFEAAKNPPQIISPQFFLVFVSAQWGWLGLGGGLCLADGERSDGKEEEGIKLPKSIQVQAPTERF